MTTKTTSDTWTRDAPFVRLPILPGSKRPVVRDWPNLDPDSPEIRIPFEIFRKQGKHINEGYRLDGLIVIDCDSPDAVEWWREAGQPSPYVSQGQPGRESHWYRAPNGYDYGVFKPRPDLEVRSGCGAQCVVPPSIHPKTGRPYRWLQARPLLPRDLPVLTIIPLDMLLTMRPVRSDTGASGGTWDRWPEGERDMMLTRVAGWLKDQGATEEGLSRALVALNQALCDPPIRDPERIARSVSRYEDIKWVDSGDSADYDSIIDEVINGPQ